MVELMIVVSIVGFLAVIAAPNFFKQRSLAQENTCISNLRVIETAKQMWGMEMLKGDGDVPTDGDLVGSQLYIRKKPECPAGGTYEYKSIGETPTCTLAGHVLKGD